MIISGVMHTAAVLAVIYGLPFVLAPEVPAEQPIVVELVEIADKTMPQTPPQKAEKETPPEPPTPPKQKHAAAPPPPPAKTEPPKPEPEAKAPAPEKVAAPPPPKPVVKEQPKPEPPKEVKVAAAPTPAPKPEEAAAQPQVNFRAAPTPRSKPTPPNRRFDASRLAALLDKSDKKAAPKSDAEKDPKKDDKPVPVREARVSSAPLTMSEIDAIRYQIQQCWSVPAGARDAEDLVVRVRVFLNSDGTIARPPEIVDSGRRDTFFLAAAESARRAVLKCTPLKNLPVEKFRQWQELTLTFNPRDMLGG
jgi:hypothetical protein